MKWLRSARWASRTPPAAPYHRFKVVTENSSGLLSNKDRPVTI